jgi:hypothetical protein
MAILQVIAERHTATHPHAFTLRGSYLVTDALAGHFPFKLREGEEHVQGQAAHGSGGIELLRH